MDDSHLGDGDVFDLHGHAGGIVRNRHDRVAETSQPTVHGDRTGVVGVVAPVLRVNEDGYPREEAGRDPHSVSPGVVRVQYVGPDLPQPAGEPIQPIDPAARSECLNPHPKLPGHRGKVAGVA